MESTSDNERKIFVLNSLMKVMPKKLWVGEDKNYAQAALLSEETDDIVYDMSNDSPCCLPKHALYFRSYNELQSWVKKINIIVNRFFYNWTVIEKLKLITYIINRYLDWHEFVAIPNFKNPVQNEFKCCSITRYLQDLLKISEEELAEAKVTLEKFLRSNKLMEDFETIDTINPAQVEERLQEFAKNWKNLYCVIAEYYQEKHEKKHILSALKLSNRSGTIMIAAHRFIWEKHNEKECNDVEEKRNKEYREKMLNRYK